MYIGNQVLETLFDVDFKFGTALVEKQQLLFRASSSAISLFDLTFLWVLQQQIALVGHQQYHHVFISILTDDIDPIVEVEERVLVAHIIHQDHSEGSSQVSKRDAFVFVISTG
eukprot:CAMPEP_0197005496 /NCGR_PEP_ID=MMETSP1380-20130617/29654_1 /TAXON_ID=5936 /ORGANISM="Euplotes crassus, Strain CT5" /LENGTH=112 /DNA_ID=CAMNT_0042424653 /DNA_START=118 /DNA_END=454 /DNA_ORIENTATION=+